MTKQSRVTIKGQVTIPNDVRDVLGLIPGALVSFERNADGEFVLRKADIDDAERRRRFEAALAAIDEARRRFPMLPMDMTTDDYMAMIREPVPDPRLP